MTNAEFEGLVDLDAFEFADVVHDYVNVVSPRWGFALKVDKDGYVVKPKPRTVARDFSQVHTVHGDLCSYPCSVQ